MSQDSTLFSPNDSISIASPWSVASQTGSGYGSLHLPSINLNDDYDLFEDDAQHYFDLLPQIQSPEPFLSDFATSQQQSPPSSQLARISPAPLFAHFESIESYTTRSLSESPDPFEDLTNLTPPRTFNQHSPPLRNIAFRNTTHGSSVVDLTESPVLTTMPTTRKRRAESPGEGRATKVARRATPNPTKATLAGEKNIQLDDAEVVDLVGLEDNVEYEAFKKKHQEDLIKQQQKDEAIRPVKFAEIQCIICMDSPTDLTITHCGI